VGSRTAVAVFTLYPSAFSRMAADRRLTTLKNGSVSGVSGRVPELL